LQEVAQIGDAPATVEAVVPFAGVARQVLGADAMEGAVEPDLHVAEQEMDALASRSPINHNLPPARRRHHDGQHGVGVGRQLSATTQGVMRLTRLARQITTYRLKAASDGEHPSLTGTSAACRL